MFRKRPPKTHLTDDGIFVIFRDFTLLDDKDFNELWRLLGVMVRGHYIQEQETKQEAVEAILETQTKTAHVGNKRGTKR